jgi:hypothetical protein
MAIDQPLWCGFFPEKNGHDLATEDNQGRSIYVVPAKDLIVVLRGLEIGTDRSRADWIMASYQFAGGIEIAREARVKPGQHVDRG